jgi:hypothetical protein
MTRTFGRAILAGASLAALAAIVACGGGGGGSGSANLPGSTSYANATFTIAVPSASTTSSTQRKAAFISPGAQSISITVTGQSTATTTTTAGATTVANLTSTSPNCSAATASAPLTCTVSLNSPVGNDTFAVSLYSGLNGAGTLLGTSTVAATIGGSGVTNVPVAIGGVVESIDVTVTAGNGLIPGGYPTSVPVVVSAKDPSGATIVGSAPYSNPITLTNADTSGITTLSTTTVTSPATVVTLSYVPTDANTGVLNVSGLPFGETSIGASASGVAPSAVSAGTFQYNSDRFFGLGHTRSFSGTGSVTTITYNGTGVPSPNPSAWSYTIAETLTLHGNQTFNGVSVLQSHLVTTYTQTSPVTAVPPEVDTADLFRGATLATSGTNVYRYGEQESDVNSGAASSPITGNAPGTSDVDYTYPTPGAWKEDQLPHTNGAAWTNNDVPYTVAYAGAQVSTFQELADGSTSFTETSPGTLSQTQTAAGAATNVNNGFTTTIGLPSGGTIPVAEQTTSPCCGATSNFTPTDWYPGGGAPAQPLYSSIFSETSVPIPAQCNVPSSVATTAYAVVQINSQLDIAAFRNRQIIDDDYFVPGGVGFVCEVVVATTSDYRFGTGIILSQTTVDTVVGVPNTTALGLLRRL